MKDTVVIMTHLLNDTVFERYRKLRDDLSKDKYDVILLINNYKRNISEDDINSISQDILYYHQTREKINSLVNSRYYVHECPQDEFIWLNLHLAYLEFYLEFKNMYDSFYYVEYDVVFTGNWSLLFDDIEKHPDIDFLAAKFRIFSKHDPWWWFKDRGTTIDIPENDRWGSFNAFLKISHKAFEYLCKQLHQQTGAFHELALITYLKQAGFRCVSLWPDNYDVVEDLSGKYCNSEIFDFESHTRISKQQNNKLYHPVK